MEVADKLELCIQSLLARHAALRDENARLGAEVARLARENSALAREMRNLQGFLASQEILRIEALRRIDGLLRKIEDYEKVGKVGQCAGKQPA